MLFVLTGRSAFVLAGVTELVGILAHVTTLIESGVANCIALALSIVSEVREKHHGASYTIDNCVSPLSCLGMFGRPAVIVTTRSTSLVSLFHIDGSGWRVSCGPRGFG